MDSRGASAPLTGITEPEITAPPPAGRPEAPGTGTRHTSQTVVAIRHWTPSLLSFRISRPPAFRFAPGHYARLGLRAANGSVVWRPFSVASAAYDEHLDFLAVLVSGGEFSDLLAGIREGDTMLLDKSSYGFLTITHFAPGNDLWLVASGSGIGPYVSILRDPATWQAYDNLIVVHSARFASELAYREEIAGLAHEEWLGASPHRMRYVPIVTPGAARRRPRRAYPAPHRGRPARTGCRCTTRSAAIPDHGLRKPGDGTRAPPPVHGTRLSCQPACHAGATRIRELLDMRAAGRSPARMIPAARGVGP